MIEQLNPGESSTLSSGAMAIVPEKQKPKQFYIMEKSYYKQAVEIIADAITNFGYSQEDLQSWTIDDMFENFGVRIDQEQFNAAIEEALTVTNYQNR